jgi:8-oxo-dGTP pyrophosphatase MutT (NUDIX family)
MTDLVVRPTVRVVLLDQADRILLMRGRLPLGDPLGQRFWFTIGGGIEAGETLAEAAAREIVEETGLADAVLGPVLWRDEVVLPVFEGRPQRLQQTYILGRTQGGPVSQTGWLPLERQLADALAWWTLPELEATEETIYPPGLAALLRDLLAGRLHTGPLEPRRT